MSELSEEAEALQQNDGLIVEEDISISANSLNGDQEEEIITEGKLRVKKKVEQLQRKAKRMRVLIV